VRFLSAFRALVTGVKEYFTAIESSTLIKVGYRERPKQSQGPGGANRIVFLPGLPNGAGGKITPPRDVGAQLLTDPLAGDAPVAQVRRLLTWERQFSVSVWAADASTTTAVRDELAQLDVVEALLEQLAQAIEQVHGVGGPNVVWGGVTWTVPKENTFGAEVLVDLAFAHPLMDAPLAVGTPGFELGQHAAPGDRDAWDAAHPRQDA
jgi:hypothetical protein